MTKFFKIAFAPPGESGTSGDLSDTGVEVTIEPSSVDPTPDPTPDPIPDSTSESISAPTVPLDVFHKRIAALTRQREELQRQLAAQTTPTTTAPIGDLHTEAMALATQMRFNERADAIARAGQAQSSDFMTRIATLNSTFGVMSPQFIETIADVGGDESTAAKILYELGGNIAKTSEIMTMSPAKQAVALAKLLGKVTSDSVPPRSQAPSPITPRIGGGGRTSSASPDLSDPKVGIEDWIKQRDATANKRRR